jgi:hypothetical protein
VSGQFLIAYIDLIVGYVVSLVCAALSVWAFVDCTIRKGPAFQARSKRTKGFWLGLTGAATFVTVLSVLVPTPFFGLSLFNIASVTIAGVYLADVRPAVTSR